MIERLAGEESRYLYIQSSLHNILTESRVSGENWGGERRVLTDFCFIAAGDVDLTNELEQGRVSRGCKQDELQPCSLG